MAVLPVSVSAPPPAAPAAEPVDAGGTFEQALAQSEAAVTSSGEPAPRDPWHPDGRHGDKAGADDGPPPVPAGDIVCAIPIAVVEIPQAAEEPDVELAPASAAAPDGEPGVADVIGSVSGADSAVKAPLPGAASAEGPETTSLDAAPAQPGSGAVEARTRVMATAPAAGVSASAPIAAGAQTQAAPAAQQAGDDTAATPEPRVVDPVRTVQRRARSSDARAAGRALAAEAIARASDSANTDTAGRGSTVATTPMQPQPGLSAAAPVPAAVATMRRQDAAAAEIVPDIVSSGQTAAAAAPDGSADAGSARQEPFDRQAPSAPRRAADLAAAISFPAQAAFAAAIERAQTAGGSAPIAPPAPDQLASVVPQVVRSVALQVTAGGGEVTLTLQPENLGTVTIALRVDQQRVTASLAADTAAVRGWLISNEHELKAGLADLGLQLDEFVVREDGRREQPSQQPDERHAQRRRKRESAESPLFEVHV